MSGKRKWKLFFLNFCIVVVDILLFSNAFLGLKLLSGSALSIAFAWTAVVMSAVVFITGNKALLKVEETGRGEANESALTCDIPDLKAALNNGDVFDEFIKRNLDQIKRFVRKRDMAHKLLLQKFSADEMSFQRFSGVLNDVENVIHINIRSILNKISAFDVEEYENMQRQGFGDDELTREKLNIYNKYIDFVGGATRTNEDILLKLDKILLEISRYNSLEDRDVQKLPAMIELDELIKNANLYK